MKKIIYIVFLFVLYTGAAWAQSNWEFVGPRSTNQTFDNKFETGQFSNITINPSNPQHLFASSWWGGLWESKNRGANWKAVDINPINSNGISAVTFLNDSIVLIGDSYQNSRYGKSFDEFRTYSKAVWKYNFKTTVVAQKWTSLGTLTNPSLVFPFCIKSIAFYPDNKSILFVCTTAGVYRSIDNGATWTHIVYDWVENMVFVPYGSPVKYYCYIAGSTGLGYHIGSDLVPDGKVMVKESANANTLTGNPNFNDLSANFNTPSPYNVKSNAKICTAPIVSGVAQFFLYTLGANGAGLGHGMEYIHTFKKNVTTGVLSAYELLTPNGSGIAGQTGTYGSPTRMAIAYDNKNKGVWYGGISLSFLYVPTKTVTYNIFKDTHNINGYIHDDIHDIQIQTYNSQLEMYMAHDAGIVRSIIGTFSPVGTPPSSPDLTKLYFKPLNNELDVCLLTGFSGTEKSKNLYAIGAHDIVNTDIYDAGKGKNRFTIPMWENDGTLIDKFDTNKMFFDENQFGSNPYYAASEDGGATVFHDKKYYHADPASNVFKKGAEGDAFSAQFTRRLFFQDPFREGRIFYVKHFRGIFQYIYDNNPDNSAFVSKISPGSLEPTPGAFQIHAWSMPVAMSFSPQTINSLHFLLEGWKDPNAQSRPSVIKYIGNNIDDCWTNHNATFYTDGNGQQQPQWTSLTNGLWESLGLSQDAMYGLKFIDIETSPWNKDVIYVMLNIPRRPDISVLKYDGSTWTNYSEGLPNEELGHSMIMDHQSNDGIYLSTNMHVYYRDASTNQWEIYGTGIPFIPARQMEINYTENTVRAGTYGRGIWKADLKCPDENLKEFNNVGIAPSFFEANYITATNALTTSHSPTVFRAVNSITLNPNFIAEAIPGGSFLAFIHGCSNPGNSFIAKNGFDAIPFGAEEDEEKEQEMAEENSVRALPNPSNGLLNLTFSNDDEKNIFIYDMMGKVVFKEENVRENILQVDISSQPTGIYLVKVMSGNKTVSKKIIIQE